MNCTSGVFKFTKSWFCTCKSSRISRILLAARRANIFSFFVWFSSKKNFLPTPNSSISSSSLQNLEEDLPLLTNVFHVTSRNRGSFLRKEREPWERDWVTTSYQEYQGQFSCCSRGVLPSVLNNEGSRAQIKGLWLSLKYNYRGALWVRPQKVEVCVCLLESKTNPIHESALSCFLLFLDHFTVLNKRTTFFYTNHRKDAILSSLN